MLGWAGLRGAIPIWLATFPVVAGVGDTSLIFNVDLLRRRHLDPDPGQRPSSRWPGASGWSATSRRCRRR